VREGRFSLDILRSFGRVRAEENPDSIRVSAIISTGDIARDGAIIDPEGWDFDDYARNPVVLYGHDDGSGGMFAGGSGALPVARTVDGPTASDNEIRATAEFDREDDMAMRLLGKIRRGFINATSVRWLPIRTEWVDKGDSERHEGEDKVLVFREQKLLEWSFVPIPADPGAVILRSDGNALDLDSFKDTKPEPKPATREQILDELDYLRSAISNYPGGMEALAARLREPAHAEIVAAVHAQLEQVIHQRPNQGANTLFDFSEVETGIREIASMLTTRPNIEEQVAAALSEATGRNIDEFRNGRTT